MMRRTSVAGWPSETNRSANRVASRSGAVPTFDFANDAETEPQGSFLRHRRHPRQLLMRLTSDGLPRIDLVWWWRNPSAHLYLRPWTYTAQPGSKPLRFWHRIHWRL